MPLITRSLKLAENFLVEIQTSLLHRVSVYETKNLLKLSYKVLHVINMNDVLHNDLWNTREIF